jgi:hypothetical protein
MSTTIQAGIRLDTAIREAIGAADRGTVYLLHFDRPYRHAGHYTGWAIDLWHRLAEHDAGRGARLLAVVRSAGIGWQLARTWTGPRSRERALKNQGGASRRCPLCGVQPRDRVDNTAQIPPDRSADLSSQPARHHRAAARRAAQPASSPGRAVAALFHPTSGRDPKP